MARRVNQACAVVVVATLAVGFWSYATEATTLGTVGGLTVHTTDVLCLLIVAVSASGVKNQGIHSLLEALLLLLSGLLLLSFLRGVMQVGNSAAGIAFRMYTVFTALIIFIYVWGSRLNYHWVLERIVWFGAGICLLGIARLVLGVHAFILDQTWVDVDLEPRIYSSGAALMLGQASLIALYLAVTRRRTGLPWNALTFVACFAMVVISDQRTATFATIAGLVALLAFVPRRQTTTLMCAGTLACAAGIGVLVIASLASQNLTQYLPHSVQMVALQEGSFGWRLDQWDIYYQTYLDGPLLNKIVGQPFGVLRVIGLGFSTLTETNRLVLPAHSGYLQLLLNVGAVGLFVFASVLVLAFVQAIAVCVDHRRVRALVGLAAAILVSQTVYGFTYSPDNEQGLLLALAVQIIASARRLPTHDQRARAQATWPGAPLGADGRPFLMRRN